jgi:glycosyltransferase involved in cell wall biosynthesis
MKISIIIPTKNRIAVLEKCLNALVAQDIDKKDFEIIVVDDGSVDETANFMRRFIAAFKGNNAFYYFQESKGAAAARNLGFEKSQGQLVLFNDDDMLQEKGCLSEHIKTHTLFPGNTSVVCGAFVTKEKASVCQCDTHYGKIRCLDRENIIWQIHWTALWTKNVSFKRDFFKTSGFFDPALEQNEDIEIGYRLSRHGLLLLRAQNALNIDACPVMDTRLFITQKAQKYGKAFFVCRRRHLDLLKDSEKDNYLEFFFPPSQESGWKKKIKFFVVRALFNAFTVKLWIFSLGFLEEHHRPLAHRISWMVFKFNHRRAYIYEEKEQKNAALGRLKK